MQQGCTDLYIDETKQPLHKRMDQHSRANSSGQDSAVHLHLKENNHSFEDNNVNILTREDRWFERSKRINLCQTGTTVFEQRRWPKTLLITHPQCFTELSPVIHIWAHLALAAHMKWPSKLWNSKSLTFPLSGHYHTEFTANSPVS